MPKDLPDFGSMFGTSGHNPAVPIADVPATELDIEAFKASVLAKLALAVGKDGDSATARDWFVATALALRDRVVHRWLAVNRASRAGGKKHVYYLSLEFLIGRLFADVVENLRLTETVSAALGDLGVDPVRMRRAEPDAALGNGGLGRLAACLMESMASLGIPASGYGIRYDHGLFRQVIRDGWQQEFAEDWLSFGNPWEFARPEIVHDIQFGGRIEMTEVAPGRVRPVWRPDETIQAVAYDTPIVGWRGRHVNPLRLWSARAVDPLRLELFNEGDHVGALSQQARAEAISKILYPADHAPSGRELRLRQEYFFVSASLQDILRRHLRDYNDLPSLPEHAAIQLNDTHPSIAVAEMMRLLIDVYALPWDVAWQATVGTFSYTNHTLLPEALERWPVDLIGCVLPRHLEIIYRINARHLEAAHEHYRKRRRRRGALDHRRNQRPPRADGSSGVCRLAPRQWRLGAAHEPDARDRIRRSAPSLPRPDRQQDQRHHLPALAAPGQSATDKIVARNLRRCRSRRHGGAGASRRALRRSGGRRAPHRRQARQQDRARAASSTSRPARRSIRTRCSTCTSSASTNTSGNC